LSADSSEGLLEGMVKAVS